MNNELIIKKCLKCGALLKIITDCNCEYCNIICCGESMHNMESNSTDGAIEKHVPTYEYTNNTLKVTVNHVMDDDHFIEWICLKTTNTEEFVYLKPGIKAEATFKNVESGIIYSYCNKHGLWKVELEKK